MADYSPISVGSATLSQLIPEPGAEVQTNEFGTDSMELSCFFGSAIEIRNSRPKRGDVYSGSMSFLEGFRVDDSKIQFIEGTSCRLRVTYMKPNPDIPYRLKIGSQISGPLVTASATAGEQTFYYTDDIPRPDAVVTKKYSMASKPHGLIGQYFKPTDPTVTDFPEVAPGFLANLAAENLWWYCTKVDYEERCNKTFYEVEENWRPVLLYPNPAP